MTTNHFGKLGSYEVEQYIRARHLKLSREIVLKAINLSGKFPSAWLGGTAKGWPPEQVQQATEDARNVANQVAKLYFEDYPEWKKLDDFLRESE